MPSPKKQSAPKIRYGIAEINGRDFAGLKPDEIRHWTQQPPNTVPCPFRLDGKLCPKKGGVCSWRLYREEAAGALPVDGAPLVTICPRRFEEGRTFLSWIGQTLLGCERPRLVPQVPFLMRTAPPGASRESDAVGMIDMVLLTPPGEPLRWCAVEIQAVYFSGKGMESDFAMMRSWAGPGIPFPGTTRRPDFRSSGPKRLLPQLQVKAPTINRWGRKLAVVIDRPFWESLEPMETVGSVSNCDIAWFVVDYAQRADRIELIPNRVYLTTLERAVAGLTGGIPTTLEDFERRLLEKAAQS